MIEVDKEMIEERRQKSISKICNDFLKSQELCHVKLFDGEFYNGSVTELGAEFVIFMDRFEGEKVLFFHEIKKIQPFREKEENNGNGS